MERTRKKPTSGRRRRRPARPTSPSSRASRSRHAATAGLRRILVGLDGSSWSRAALAQAFHIARSTGAVVTGVAVLDNHEIEQAVGPAPLGAIAFAERRERQMLEQAREHVTGLLKEFRRCCERERVPHFETFEEGAPFRRLVRDSLSHDLVVLGLRTYFHFPASDRPSHTLERVLEHGVRPVLAVRESTSPIRRVAVALDDSPQAARTLQLFALLCRWELQTLRLVHAGDARRAAPLLDAAAAYLEAHGRRAEKVVLEGSPREVIPQYVSSQDMDLVVLGAHGKEGLAKFLFGSLTATLIEEPRASLLLYH